MKLIKCPRCELNYIYENETMCAVCRKDVRGEKEPEEMLELCSECGENPVVPGQEVCAFCLKEMQRRNDSIGDSPEGEASARDLENEAVSSMDEIEMDEDYSDDEFDDEDFEGEDDYFDVENAGEEE